MSEPVLYFCYCIQAWIRNGIISKCGHPANFQPACTGCSRSGEAFKCPKCIGHLIQVTPPAQARYRFISDPGHGWLEVPTQELRELGIYASISTCSFMSREDGGFCYLEEDCDLHRFAVAKGWERGDAWPIRTLHQENTFIRKLPHFDPERRS